MSFFRGSLWFLVTATVFLISGCASNVALDHAVIAYDTTTANSISKQLLLNIARARHNQPMHFTAISNIAATYKFTVNAGVGGAITGERGSLLVPLFGSSAEENPTVSISPMQGDEFTQRLLTPFQEQKLTLLLRQSYDVDSLLRLMGAELRLQTEEPSKISVYNNRPSDRAGYTIFRQVVSHLSTIQDRHALYVEPLNFQRTWTVPAAAVTPETFATTYKDYSLTYIADQRAYLVSKRVNGRVMITNYDPSTLSNEERLKLHAEAEEAPVNDIFLDIRKGYIGGEYRLHGRLRLRSFHEILTFIGRGIKEEPEFHVAPHPATPPVTENPVHTLELMETNQIPFSADLSVLSHGFYYAVRDQNGYQWNKKAFSLLYQLFQMSVYAEEKSGPIITISK
jgi:hypothetical protein